MKPTIHDYIEVVPVTKSQCRDWVTKKHYAKREPIFWYGFGLVIDGMIEGVVVYGQPSPAVQKYAFSGRDFRLLELSRLVIQTEMKNAASLLVGRSLQMLPAPCAVVSYADSEMGHCGIVYQATNWIYTGATVSHDKAYMVDGVRVHPMTLRDRGITAPAQWAKENGVSTVSSMPKHRYFFFVGNRRDRRRMKDKLRYGEVATLPKACKSMYDHGGKIVQPIIDQQPELF